MPRLSAVAAVLALACAAAPAPRPGPAASGPQAAAGEALDRFVSAAEDGRWPEAWALLSARWRARTTPVRLAQDYRASGPVGPEAAARVKALRATGAAPAVAGAEATLAVGEGRRARLVAEDGAWRVDALE